MAQALDITVNVSGEGELQVQVKNASRINTVVWSTDVVDVLGYHWRIGAANDGKEPAVKYVDVSPPLRGPWLRTKAQFQHLLA